MIKISQCKIIAKQCNHCNQIKLIKQFNKRSHTCNSCYHRISYSGLNPIATCEVCGTEYLCSHQEIKIKVDLKHISAQL